MALISGVGARLRRLFRLLVTDPRFLWLAIVVPIGILAAAWCFLPYAPDLRVRVAGFGSTVLGVFLVVRGLVKTQQLFKEKGYKGYRERFADWLRQFPPIFRRARTEIVAVGGSQIGISGSATAVVSSPSAGRRTTSERLSALEARATAFDERLTSMQKAHASDIKSLRVSHQHESETRVAALAAIDERLEELSVRGIDVELMAVGWFLFGETFTTLTDLIVACLTAMFGGP
jgi:hypothetical protein